MDAAVVITVASATIAVFALGFGLVQYSERRRQQFLTDLQGGNEAAATVATKARHGKLPRWKRNRTELLEAMCFAAVFEESGQFRSLLYAALAKAMATAKYHQQITSCVEELHAVVSRNSPYTDLVRARWQLFALRAALSIDDDLRMRLECIDIVSDKIRHMVTPDARCTDETHSWSALKEVLRQRASIVVVCPRIGPDGYVLGCATLALDFHKVAQFTANERFQLTELGKRFHRAKYRQSVTDLKSIALELADVIAGHSAYNRAAVIVVVPGRHHDFSVQLGKAVASITSKSCVLLMRQSKADIRPKFTLADSASIRDKEVIILDDVYRTGDTLRDATQMLREAGARKVLGLTATSTVSAIGPHCYDQ